MTSPILRESIDALRSIKGCTVEYAVMPALTVNTSGLTGIERIFQLEEARPRQFFYTWPITLRIKDKQETYRWLALDAGPKAGEERWAPVSAEFVDEPRRGRAGGVTFSDGWTLAAVSEDQRPAIYNCYPRSAIIGIQITSRSPYAAIHATHEDGEGWLFYAEHESHAWLTFDEEIINALLEASDQSVII